AGDAVALDDLRHLLREFGDLLQLPGHRAHAHIGGDRPAQRLRVQLDPVAADHAGFLQPREALLHCRRRHADAAGELADRLARVFLQSFQQLDIARVGDETWNLGIPLEKPLKDEKQARTTSNYVWIMRRLLGKWEPMSELPFTSSIPRLAPPPQLYFVVSAIFHYLGPAFAVLLFARVEPLGVAWLRIASAALIFAAWRRPWRHFRQLTVAARWNIVALGVVLGCMNACFYLAIDRLPLATVGAIEFLGPIALALAGLRTRRNTVAFALVVAGVWFLTHLRFAGMPLGFVFAFANCALFALYIMLGHRVANDAGGRAMDGLGA